MLDDLIDGTLDAALGASDALDASNRRNFWVGLGYNLLGVLLVLGALTFAILALGYSSKLWWVGAVVCLVGAAAAFIYSFYVRRVRDT